MLELYHHSTSVCAAKVRLVLAEKGIDGKGTMSISSEASSSILIFSISSQGGRAYVSSYEGNVIRESTVINEYLDEVFPFRR